MTGKGWKKPAWNGFIFSKGFSRCKLNRKQPAGYLNSVN